MQTTSARLLQNTYFVESCFKHSNQYPHTTRSIHQGIPVETFDDFDYNDVKFTVSLEVYHTHIKNEASTDKFDAVKPGAMKHIEQIIYEQSKVGPRIPYCCIPKLPSKAKPRYVKTQNILRADCVCAAHVSVCPTKLVYLCMCDI